MMRSRSSLLLGPALLLALHAAPTTTASRQTVSLDLDWRFHHVKPGRAEGELLGKIVEAQTCEASRFEPMKKQGCKGLTRVYPGGSALGQGWYNTGPGSIDEDTCRSICCANNDECAVWNWCPKGAVGGCKVPPGGTPPAGSPGPAANGTCWIGWSNDWNAQKGTCHSFAGWVGGTRRAPQHEPVPSPADRATGAAGREYNDSAWALKSLPHDFVVEGTPDMLDGDKSHGYLPKGIGWYRKQFTLTAEDKERDLTLEFGGAYRDAMVFVNGRFVGRHKSGYTSFSFALPAEYVYYGEGETNTLAVRVDANLNEGWFYGKYTVNSTSYPLRCVSS